ncbi:hypothetical protein ABH926_001001 [Catenulispora sp. GP43]|uniref:hypothetical protein n=1 Tax=Catenulispora sp. GP43 TaxID=3156263 RepID=UPI00351781E4
MVEEQPSEQRLGASCRWRRTERRTRGAKEIELEIRLRERQRARRYADRGERDRLRYLPLLPVAAPGQDSSYR